MADKKPSYPPPYPEGTSTEVEPVEYPKHVTNADGQTVTVHSKEEEAKATAGAKKGEKSAEKPAEKAHDDVDPNEPRFGSPKK